MFPNNAEDRRWDRSVKDIYHASMVRLLQEKSESLGGIEHGGIEEESLYEDKVAGRNVAKRQKMNSPSVEDEHMVCTITATAEINQVEQPLSGESATSVSSHPCNTDRNASES